MVYECDTCASRPKSQQHPLKLYADYQLQLLQISINLSNSEINFFFLNIGENVFKYLENYNNIFNIFND